MWKRSVIGAVLFVACGNEDGSSASERGASIEARNEECAALKFDQCATNADCRLVSGTVVDDAKQCLGARVEVGCIAADNSCDEALTTFKAPDGARWVLNDSCGPQGFVRAPAPNATSFSSCVDSQQTMPSKCPAGAEMVSPGCGASEPTWAKGCYVSCSAVGSDAGCAPGFTCQETWIDPCVPEAPGQITCAACGRQTHLCLAAPTDT